jgi:hypothetical protein
MKSFKQIISEIAVPKPAEEKAFWDQHSQAIGKHPVATDAQHKGIDKPKAKRKADQEGDANYDKAVMNKDTRMKGAAVGVNEAADTASPDESSMAMDQADFIAYVAGEMKEHLKAGKEFPEWMQNKLSKLQQAAQDLHGNFGAHGDDMDEALSSGQKKLDHNKNGKIDAHDFQLMRKKKMKEEAKLDEATFSMDIDYNYEKKLEAGAKKAGLGVKFIQHGGATEMVLTGDKDKITKFLKARRVPASEISSGFIKEEAEQIDEISQETLRQYHGKAGADLRAKRDKLDKGTLTTADLKKGQNRVKGLNRAANKMEEVEQLDELSPKTLDNYKTKASMGDKSDSALRKKARAHKTLGNDAEAKRLKDKAKKRSDSFTKAAARSLAQTTGYTGEKGSKLDKAANKMPQSYRKVPRKEEVELDETTSSALKRPVTQTGSDGKTRTVMKKARTDVTNDRGQDKITTRESVEVMDEAFRQGIVKFNDKSQMILKKEDADALNNLFKNMSSSGKNKMTKEAMESKKAFEEILSFAKEA